MDGAALDLILRKRTEESSGGRQVSRGRFARAAQPLALHAVQHLFKIDRIPYSMLDVGRSMFDVHFLLNPSDE